MTAKQWANLIRDVAETLSGMQTALTQAEKDLREANAELEDLEHELELLPLARDQLAQRARLIRDCRKKRRAAKDEIEALQKIVPLLSRAGVFKAIDEADRMICDTVKGHEARFYRPKVRDKEWRAASTDAN